MVPAIYHASYAAVDPENAEETSVNALSRILNTSLLPAGTIDKVSFLNDFELELFAETHVQDCQSCQLLSSSVKAGVFRCPSTCCSCSIRERYDDSCIIILAGITRHMCCFRRQHWASCCSVFTEYSTRTYSWPHSTSTIYVYYSYYQKTQRITTLCNIAQLFVRGHGRIVSHDDVIQLHAWTLVIFVHKL